MTCTLCDYVGFIGDGIIIVTYVLLQAQKVHSEDLTYSVLNAVGASMIIVSLIFKFNFAAFIVEFFWVLVSLYGVGKYVVHSKARRRTVPG